MSLLNLILCCRRTRTSTKVISLGCLSLSRANNSTPSCKKKTHIDSINRWLSAFAVYCTVLLTSFPHRAVCLPRDNPIITLQVHRVCVAILGHFFPQERAGNLALSWGEQDIQLYLLKCTGQAKSSSLFVGVGTIFLMAAPFLPLGQLPPEEECAIISTVVPNAAKTPAPSTTTARSVMGITRPFEIILITPAPIGLRSAPFLFNQLSDALEWLVKNYLNIFPLFISLMTFSSPNKHPAPSVQQLCAGPYLV